MQSIQDLKKNLEMSSTLSASVSEKSIIKKKKKNNTPLCQKIKFCIYITSMYSHVYILYEKNKQNNGNLIIIKINVHKNDLTDIIYNKA